MYQIIPGRHYPESLFDFKHGAGFTPDHPFAALKGFGTAEAKAEAQSQRNLCGVARSGGKCRVFSNPTVRHNQPNSGLIPD
jgi:hypothetical protein